MLANSPHLTQNISYLTSPSCFWSPPSTSSCWFYLPCSDRVLPHHVLFTNFHSLVNLEGYQVRPTSTSTQQHPENPSDHTISEIMDPNSNRNGNTKERQLRFKPVARARKIPKNVVVKSEVEDNKDERGLAMLKAFNADKDAKKKVKFEQKVEPTTSQQYNVSRGIGDKYQDNAYSYTSKMKLKKDYVEPWDYTSHYPVTHPVRRPYSGDPVLLDKEEFGTKGTEVHEQPRNTAFELGLMVEQDELDKPTYIRMQFPLFMPMTKLVEDKEKEPITKEASKESKPPKFHMEPCRLNELPAGHLGKLRVYKSGAVKLHIGDVVYNVSSGLECSFAQELVSINVAERDYCAIDEVSKQAIMIPDFDSVINNL